MIHKLNQIYHIKQAERKSPARPHNKYTDNRAIDLIIKSDVRITGCYIFFKKFLFNNLQQKKQSKKVWIRQASRYDFTYWQLLKIFNQMTDKFFWNLTLTLEHVWLSNTVQLVFASTVCLINAVTKPTSYQCRNQARTYFRLHIVASITHTVEENAYCIILHMIGHYSRNHTKEHL